MMNDHSDDCVGMATDSKSDFSVGGVKIEGTSIAGMVRCVGFRVDFQLDNACAALMLDSLSKPS